MTTGCTFCHDINGTAGRYNFVIGEAGDVVVIADAAPLLEGHILLTTRAHHMSFAQADSGTLDAARELIDAYELHCQDSGQALLVAEHGSGPAGSHSNACCEHAHIHLIPLPNPEVFEAIKAVFERHGGEGREISSLSQLHSLPPRAYNLIGLGNNDLFVWEDTQRFFNQFFRFAVVSSLQDQLSQSQLFWQESIDVERALKTAQSVEATLFGTHEWSNTEFVALRKLVRDKIPALIKSNGSSPVLDFPSTERMQSAAIEKVLEEADEFTRSPSLEEAADIVEALEAALGYPDNFMDELSKAKFQKLHKNGGLNRGIVLRGIVREAPKGD